MRSANGLTPVGKNDLLIVGSMALDTVETPTGVRQNALGGSATYCTVAASFFTTAHLIGVVGQDFPKEHLDFLARKNIGLDGLQISAGLTFRWSGSYMNNINEAETRRTDLNVLAEFEPRVPDHLKKVDCLFLANLDPDAQMHVLRQMNNPRLIAGDTMNLWINHKRQALEKVLRSIQIFVLNDGEAKLLTGEHNVVRAGHIIKRWGPKYVVIKKGEHGSFLFSPHHKVNVFVTPAFPLEHVVDPTGAGDTFAGGFMGHLSRSLKPWDTKTLRQAIIFGNVMASYTVESFSLDRLKSLKPKDIVNRYKNFQKITEFASPVGFPK